MKISPDMFHQVTHFFILLLDGSLDHPAALATELEKMAKLAWLEAEQIEQSAIRIP